MTRKSMLRRTAGTVLLLLSLGLTNCQAVVGTLVGGSAGLAMLPEVALHA